MNVGGVRIKSIIKEMHLLAVHFVLSGQTLINCCIMSSVETYKNLYFCDCA